MNNAALMNFDISIVQPDPVTHRREFRQTGAGQGECFLNCHGVAHSPKTYGGVIAPVPVPVAPLPPSDISPTPSPAPVLTPAPTPSVAPTPTPVPAPTAP
jgi:hypothetical protein